MENKEISRLLKGISFLPVDQSGHSSEQRGKKIRLLLTYVKISFSPLLCRKGTNLGLNYPASYVRTC